MNDLEALERRVAALEQEVEGEKVVSHYILEQVRRNADDLAALRTRMEKRFEGVDARFDHVEGRLERLKAQFRALRTDLPTIVADAVREVLRERDSKR